LLKSIIRNMLGADQEIFLLVLKVGYEALRAGKPRVGQALALAGPRACGKSLLQNYSLTSSAVGANPTAT